VRPVVTPERMRAIDAAAPVPVEVLVERAGAAVARVALHMLGGGYGRRVVVLAGPGNNGADGRVAAARLRERGVQVTVHDAVAMPPHVSGADLVIDAAFGSGFRGEWRPPRVDGAPVLAVDVPTGLDGLTGEAGKRTGRADATVTFVAPRPGHLLGRGPELCGELHVVDIGLDATPPDDQPPDERMYVVEAGDVAEWIPERARRSHKWSSAVRVVAGSAGMTGAAHLASAAAQRAGAGMVTVSSPGIDDATPVEVVGRRIPPFDWAEAVLDDLYRYHALVVGPGLGREEYTVPSVVRTVTDALVPVVVDGDGLFALAWNDEGTPAFLSAREVPTVLTPHDGEYATLTGHRPGADRVAALRRLIGLTGATVLLKGPTTLVGGPGTPTWFVTNGDQRLATAGTGDVLAGVIGAMLGRGLPAIRAAVAGAWIHAEAANLAGREGLVAGDLLEQLPVVLTRLRAA
jgi:ADP-dependent NAD(P)H-hydrate dehydratase / NAD(P)H-hydrate epimerase